jgi:hypothetical protein
MAISYQLSSFNNQIPYRELYKTITQLVYTASAVEDNNNILIFANASNSTLNLPPAAHSEGMNLRVWNNNSGTATVVVDPHGAELINGLTTLTLNVNEGVKCFAYRGRWLTTKISANEIYTSAVVSGSTFQSVLRYNGTTATSGAFDGGTTTPSGTTRLNYGGYFYPTFINLIGSSDTTTAASHYFVETGSDGFVRPKTLANVRAEIGAWTRVTSNYTAVNGDRIIADSSTGSFVITLPASPPTGAVIVVADGNNWSVNTINVARNGATIEGFAEDLQLDVPGIRVDLVYDGTTWEAYTFATPQASVVDDTTTNTTQYINMVRNTSGALQNSYVSSTNLYFNPLSGAVSATDFNSLSDATLKENISNITNAIDILDAIRPVEFNWKNNGKKSYGVLAQEIEQILPQVVETNKDNNIKSVSYTQLVPILIESIKELKREIQILKEEKK